MSENRSYFATLIIVVLAALVAALLLVAAFVVWLAGLMGTLLYPCLIVGLALAIFAIILYKVSLCDIMREMHERIGVIYEVTRILRECAEWVTSLLFRK